MSAFLASYAPVDLVLVAALLAGLPLSLLAGFGLTRLAPARPGAARWLGWALVLGGFGSYSWLTASEPPGIRMLLIIGIVLFAMKGVVAVETIRAGGPALNARQVRFLSLLKSLIASAGAVELERLYEPPFTTLDPDGIDGLFDDETQIDQVLGHLLGSGGAVQSEALDRELADGVERCADVAAHEHGPGLFDRDRHEDGHLGVPAPTAPVTKVATVRK